MKKQLALLVAAGFAAAVTAQAQSTITYNLAALPPSTLVYNSGDGVWTVGTENGGVYSPGASTASLGWPAPGGIANTTTGDYPTTTGLEFIFASPVTLDSFGFNNWGENDTSYFTAYDSSHNILATANIGGAAFSSGGTDTVNLPGVSEIVFDNGTGGSYSWELGVTSLTVDTTVTPTPEPGTISLAGLGGVAMLLLRRRK